MSESKSKNLIQIYQGLKHKYRNYDTRDALKRMQAFRKAIQALDERGFSVGLEILGSINFGIVEKQSDVDLILFHYCRIHKEQDECMPICSNLSFEREIIAHTLCSHLHTEKIHIETLDCINLHHVANYIAKKDKEHYPTVLRFLFYGTIGRPVHFSLVSKFYDILTEDSEIMKEFYEWGSEILSAYLQTSDHRLSFHKYNERILNLGLDLPEGLKKELEEYLD